MKARMLWCLVAAVPMIAAGCASSNGVRPGDRTFDKETQAPGSAVSQAPVVVAPAQPTVVQPSQAPVVVAPGQTVVVPAPAGTVTVPGAVTVPATQVVQADELQANEVRAQ